MKYLITLGLLLASLGTQAETPVQIRQTLAAEAAAAQAGFAPSAVRGEQLFRKQFAVSDQMPACTSCHSANPAQGGQHAVTGKPIKPMAVAANRERFTDPARVEKWFGRNCKEVIGRACSAGEKADFVAYMSEVR